MPKDKTPSNHPSQRQFQQQIQIQHHQGPLPPPELLERYEKIIPGIAERLLMAAEKHADHIYFMERQTIGLQEKQQECNFGTIQKALKHNSSNIRYAFILLGTGMLCGTYLASIGSIAGFTILIGELVSMGGLFLYGEYKKRKAGPVGEVLEDISKGYSTNPTPTEV